MQFSNTPAITPPKGVQSNFDDPPSRGPDLIVASIICLTLMVMFVSMRIYSKVFIKHSWGWSDHMCMLASIGTIGFAAISISLVRQGIGRHQWDTPISVLTNEFIRETLAVNIIYPPSILAAKLSILLLYLEAFHPKERLRYCIYLGIVSATLFYIAMFTADFVLGMPRPGESLLELIASHKFGLLYPLGVAQGGFNVVSDFYILLLPVYGIRTLNLPLRKKIAAYTIFMTGLLACLSSVMGLVYRIKLHLASGDTWQLVPAMIWVIVELTAGVICSCMSCSAVVVRHHASSLKSFSIFLHTRAKCINRLRPMGLSSSDTSDKPSVQEIQNRLDPGFKFNSKNHQATLTSVIATEVGFASLGNAPYNPVDRKYTSSGTRREWHESMAEVKHQLEQQPLGSHPPPSR